MLFVTGSHQGLAKFWDIRYTMPVSVLSRVFSPLCFFLVYFLVFVFFSRIVSFARFSGLAIAHARAKVETFNKELVPFGTSGTRSWGSFSLVCSFPYIQHTSVLELRFFKEGLPSSGISGTHVCCFSPLCYLLVCYWVLPSSMPALWFRSFARRERQVLEDQSLDFGVLSYSRTYLTDPPYLHFKKVTHGRRRGQALGYHVGTQPFHSPTPHACNTASNCTRPSNAFRAIVVL
jgi:hypothetical protein